MSGYTSDDVDRLVVEPAKTAALPGMAAVSGRSAFARDRARVLHSASFRRLAGKTQVVAPDEDAVPRTRLTHSLEVAQIAREIGAQLGCDPDLVDLAGLAHDIGHPPFGHNGEEALDAAAAPAGGFEANAQNLRLLTMLEPKVIDDQGRPAGLNLTRASLDAVIKYPWFRPAHGGKFGVYETEAAVFGWVRSTVPAAAPSGRLPSSGPSPGPAPRCLEVQVMDWADDVAYSVHDVEDGVGAGRIDLGRLRDPHERHRIADAARVYSGESEDDLARVLAELLSLPVISACIDHIGGPNGDAAVKRLTSELTGRLATGAIAATRPTGTASGRDRPEALCRYAADLVVPPVLRAEVAVLKAIAFHYVMTDPVRIRLQQCQQELLIELVDTLADRGGAALDRPFRPAYEAAAGDAERLRVVVDQVSLLTDAQAVARHRRTTGTVSELRS